MQRHRRALVMERPLHVGCSDSVLVGLGLETVDLEEVSLGLSDVVPEIVRGAAFEPCFGVCVEA